MLDRAVLCNEHARIEALFASVRDDAAARPPRVEAIAKTRWHLSRVILAHLAKEDRMLHPLLQRVGSTEVAALSRRFEREMGGLSDAFKAWIADWDGTRIAADPDAFERHTAAVAGALSDRIHAEETHLYRHIPVARVVDAAARRA